MGVGVFSFVFFRLGFFYSFLSLGFELFFLGIWGGGRSRVYVALYIYFFTGVGKEKNEK